MHIGLVTEVLPAGLYRVQIEDKGYICHLSGKMKFNHIRVAMGDRVEVLVDPYGGKTTNRIVQRLKAETPS